MSIAEPNVEQFVGDLTAGDPARDFLRDYRRPLGSLLLCSRLHLLDRYRELTEDEPTPEVQAELEAIDAEITASTVEFRFEALGASAWQALMREHPAQDHDRAIGLTFSVDGFPPAAVAACSTAPKLEVATVRLMREHLPPSEWTRLWSLVFSLNVDDPLAVRRG